MRDADFEEAAKSALLASLAFLGVSAICSSLYELAGLLAFRMAGNGFRWGSLFQMGPFSVGTAVRYLCFILGAVLVVRLYRGMSEPRAGRGAALVLVAFPLLMLFAPNVLTGDATARPFWAQAALLLAVRLLVSPISFWGRAVLWVLLAVMVGSSVMASVNAWMEAVNDLSRKSYEAATSWVLVAALPHAAFDVFFAYVMPAKLVGLNQPALSPSLSPAV